MKGIKTAVHFFREPLFGARRQDGDGNISSRSSRLKAFRAIRLERVSPVTEIHII